MEGQEDSDSDDEDIEGVWDVQMASFREVDKCDEGASEERGGDFDFGFFFGESTPPRRRRRRRVTMKK